MTWNRVLVGLIVALVGVVVWLTIADIRSFRALSAVVTTFEPGDLSVSHAFLKQQCAACHSPNQGVSAASCISCHANNVGLLRRQSTAFHANVTSCKECHKEHMGGVRPPLTMDHLALANLGVRGLDGRSAEPHNQILRGYLNKKRAREFAATVTSVNPREPQIVSVLNCMTCHATRDKHQGYFGTSCLSCHSSQSWRISEYKHPSTNSRNCVQCHQPPPSHNMMHFEMVSKKVAGQEHANVSQCFLCHQSSSWNEIKGVGWYKHH